MVDKVATEEELFGAFKSSVSVDGERIKPEDEDTSTTGWGDDEDDEDESDDGEEADDDGDDDDGDEEGADDDDGSDDDDGDGSGDSDGDRESDDEVDEDASSDDDDESARERGSRKKSARERIAEITAARRAAERDAEVKDLENAALKERLAAIKAGQPDPVEVAAAAAAAEDEPPKVEIDEAKVLSGLEKPDASKFKYGEFDDGYIAAMHEWGAERAARLRAARETATKEAVTAKAAEKASKERTTAIVQTFVDKVVKPGLKQFKDFDKVVVEAAKERKFPLTPETGEMLADFENGASIIYHLAKNLDEAKELAGKSTAGQAAHLAQLSARLSPKGAGDGNVRTKTKAPKPAGTRPRGGAGPQSPNAATTDFSKFEKMVKRSQKE